jgi:hypothetical protein
MKTVAGTDIRFSGKTLVVEDAKLYTLEAVAFDFDPKFSYFIKKKDASVIYTLKKIQDFYVWIPVLGCVAPSLFQSPYPEVAIKMASEEGCQIRVYAGLQVDFNLNGLFN